MKTTTLNLIWFIENITSTRLRHWHGTLLLVLICFGMNGPSQGAAGVAPFQVGERVRTFSQSAIYLASPFAGRFITTERIGVQGTISEGPVRSADVWWWKVRFDDGVDGWVAERQIRNSNGQPAGPRINSTVQVITSPATENTSGEFANLNPPNGST